MCPPWARRIPVLGGVGGELCDAGKRIGHLAVEEPNLGEQAREVVVFFGNDVVGSEDSFQQLFNGLLSMESDLRHAAEVFSAGT